MAGASPTKREMAGNGLVLVHCAAMFLICAVATDRLSIDYYNHSCPEVEAMVREALLPIFVADPRSPAAFLRLLFHDCQVQGCDASILLDTDGDRMIVSEMESANNFGIRNRESIQLIKAVVEAECPGVVSCADLVALAAKEAVAYSGGPRIQVPLGRTDSTTSGEADDQLPSPSTGVDGALRLFASKGMTVQESVAMLGAHTIGVGHCKNLAQRGGNVFDGVVRLTCLTNGSVVFNDLTALVFDNQYYNDVSSGRGRFAVDDGASTDARTAPIVREFAEDQDYFFRVFSGAFVKLSSSDGDAGAGQIRRQCNQVN